MPTLLKPKEDSLSYAFTELKKDVRPPVHYHFENPNLGLCLGPKLLSSRSDR